MHKWRVLQNPIKGLERYERIAPPHWGSWFFSVTSKLMLGSLCSLHLKPFSVLYIFTPIPTRVRANPNKPLHLKKLNKYKNPSTIELGTVGYTDLSSRPLANNTHVVGRVCRTSLDHYSCSKSHIFQAARIQEVKGVQTVALTFKG